MKLERKIRYVYCQMFRASNQTEYHMRERQFIRLSRMYSKAYGKIFNPTTSLESENREWWHD